jgi:transcription elongation factor Elf1
MNKFSAEHHALIFAYVAKECIEKFGGKGKNAITDAVKEYGTIRGKRMLKLANKNGISNDFIGYVLCHDMDLNAGGVKKKTKLKPFVDIHCTQCGWYKTWESNKVLNYGKIYCQYIDEYLVNSFNPNLGYKVHSTRSNGGKTCHMCFHNSKVGFIDILKLLFYSFKFNNKQSWDTLTIDFYQILNKKIIEKFGTEGRNIMNNSLILFKNKFGENAYAMITNSNNS